MLSKSYQIMNSNTVLYLLNKKWQHYSGIHYIGELTLEDVILLLSVADEDLFSYIRKKNFTHFTIVENTKTVTRIITDFSSSYPLIIYFDDKIKKLHIADNINELTQHTNLDIDLDSRRCIEAFGYTLGTRTVLKNVAWVPPFSHYRCVDEGIIYDTYYTKSKEFAESVDYESIENQLVDQLSLRLKKKVALPISAGLDSKLLAKLLKKVPVNVNAFSYGPKSSWDVVGGKLAAKLLNIPWVHLNFSKKEHSNFIQSQDFKALEEYCDIGVSMFYYQDAFIVNKQVNSIRQSVLINGNTGDFVSGGHLSSKIYDMKIDDLVSYILKKIAVLWNDQLNFGILSKLIDEEIHRIRAKYSARDNLEILYFFELENRQSKYVISGQRIYDYFDLDWTLPFWWPVFLSPHFSVDKKFIAEQVPYKSHLMQNDKQGLFTSSVYSKRFNRHYWIRSQRKLFKIVAKLVPVLRRYEYSIFLPKLSTLHQTAHIGFLQSLRLRPIKKETAYFAMRYIERWDKRAKDLLDGDANAS